MQYKAIILDMDGTLLNSEHVISSKTKEALIKAQENGLIVVLASGRPTAGMKRFAQELKIQDFGSYIISFNGGKITNLKTGETVFHQGLKAEDVHLLIDKAKEHHLSILTYEGDYIICEETNKYIDYEAELNQIEIKTVENLKEYVQFDCTKCLMVGDKELVVEAEQALAYELPQYNFARSLPFFLENTAHGIDKAQTLEKLIEILGIKQEEVIACGDGNNDVTMIQFAGLGVAMQNGTEKVKSVADYITKTNDEDGIVHVLEQYVFNR